ncbi:hypothetical protein [Bifidobacterium coryneforme]|uniref:hypothetical protein n=1 Tax=Bifidobacterium coryneforme TaxID=1687 RepID=UPI0012E02035|nr:hypothetical protein [Bifidobacterium coryneforme]
MKEQKDDCCFVFLNSFDEMVIEQPYDKIAAQTGSFIARLHIGLKGFAPQRETTC